jgi:hypothetical protein
MKISFTLVALCVVGATAGVGIYLSTESAKLESKPAAIDSVASMSEERARTFAELWVKDNLADSEATVVNVTPPHKVMGRDHVLLTVRTRNMVGAWLSAYYVMRADDVGFDRVWALPDFFAEAGAERTKLGNHIMAKADFDRDIRQLLPTELWPAWNKLRRPEASRW